MFLDVLAVLAPLGIGVYLTWTQFYTYYAAEPLAMLPLMIVCIASGLCISLLSLGKDYRIRFLWSLFFPFIFCYCAAYNFVFLSFAIIIAALSGLLKLPKGRTYATIDVLPDGDFFVIHHRAKRTLRDTCIFQTNVLMFFTYVIFFFTFIFQTPTRFWNVCLFPVAWGDEAVCEYAVPSGLVTATAWYSENAFLIGGFFEVDGNPSPCEEAGMLPGDVVTKINGEDARISSFIVNGATEEPVTITVLRSDSDSDKSFSEMTFTVTPIYSETDGLYRIGITYYEKASLFASVQTLSFYYPETGLFAATAHSADPALEDAEALSGVLTSSTVIGRDGDGLKVEISGIIGSVDYTSEYGSFGTLSEGIGGDALPIAKKSELRRGKATMLSSFEGGDVQAYDVYITGTYRIDGRDVITLLAEDERITSFGGVTRGMSGSPIIQNGKIIGALSNTNSDGRSAFATFACDMANELTNCVGDPTENITEVETNE